MKELKIGLVQMRCEKGELDKNIKQMENYIKAARAHGTEILCFPEMCITGYINPIEQGEAVIDMENDYINKAIYLSKIYDMVVIAGFVEKNSDRGLKPYITSFAAYNGEIICKYRKITIIDEETDWFSAGSELGIFHYNDLKLGISICADIDNPRLFNEYGREEVDIVFEAAAPGLYGEQATRNWESGFIWWRKKCLENLGYYAKQNNMFIAVSTQAGRTMNEDFPGGGYIINSKGEFVSETKDWGEGIHYGTLKL